MQSEFDVIVVGAGAGGGVAAGVLAEAGKTVLVLDRGRALGINAVPRDHLRNHRISQYGYNTETPAQLAGRPRVAVNVLGREEVVSPENGGYGYNASVLGGGTLVYGAQAWRFLPDDFRMASRYGVPEGSSLADWPISYEDLEPFYDKVEWEMGVAGSPHVLSGKRERDFPMPPVALNLSGQTLKCGADQLGWPTGPVPLLINTVPYNGRGACIGCGMCVGFSCPTDAKVGSQNTMIPRALKTGRCTLTTGATVASLVTENGKVVGVRYFKDDKEHVARAKTVVLAAAAIETARLLLNSRTDREPNGIGNNSDHVGRHIQGHYYPGAIGLFDDVVQDGVGPGVSISTLKFNHNNPGIVGGGMLANEFVKLPIIFQKNCWQPGVPRWGIEAKRYMRHAYTRAMHVQGPVQEIPSANGRVTVDSSRRDRFGIPVPRLSGTQHESTVDVGQFMQKRAEDWLRASGAKEIWSWAPPLFLSHGQHQAGTTRMSDDPKNGVVDRHCRVHGHDNLFVADGGPHVTNAGLNPVLTILALAWRTAEFIAGN